MTLRTFSNPGFTIIETVITLVLTAIISAIAIPRAASFIDSIEVHGATTEAVSMFSTARQYAIARGTQTIVDIDQLRGTITIKAAGRAVSVAEIAAAHSVKLTTNRTSITYSAIGVGYGAANLTMTLSRGRSTDTIVVSRLGRVRN